MGTRNRLHRQAVIEGKEKLFRNDGWWRPVRYIQIFKGLNKKDRQEQLKIDQVIERKLMIQKARAERKRLAKVMKPVGKVTP